MAINVLPPSADPAFLAYLRAQGVEESSARGAVAQRISALQRALNLRLPAYDAANQQSQENISNDFENRGLFRSGARLVSQQRSEDTSNRQRLGDVASTYDQMAGAQGDLAQQVATLRRQRAEQELNARQNIASGGLV